MWRDVLHPVVVAVMKIAVLSFWVYVEVGCYGHSFDVIVSGVAFLFRQNSSAPGRCRVIGVCRVLKIRRLIEKFQDWLTYSESDDSTGPTICFFFKVASFTLNTFLQRFINNSNTWNKLFCDIPFSTAAVAFLTSSSEENLFQTHQCMTFTKPSTALPRLI
jgi:hypothetical protein